MHRLKYQVETLSPLIITERLGDNNTTACLEYIPGHTILGFLANTWIKKQKLQHLAHENENFYHWFLKGALSITPAYPSKENKVFFPTPLSIHQDKAKTQIYDLLYETPAEQTKKIGQFCHLEENGIYLHSVSRSLQYHHARDEKDPKDPVPFTYESIDAGQIFEGWIVGEQEQLNQFREIFSESWKGAIGRSRSAQYGQIKFQFDGHPETFFSLTNIQPQLNQHTLSMTFLSDVLIYNENGFPSTHIQDLKAYLPAGVQIKKALVNTGSQETHVGIWGLKRPSETVLKAGSCFLLTAQTATEQLLKLQQTGMGERRQEGFGQLVFNWQKDQDLTKGTQNLINECPQSELPILTRNILNHVFEQSIYQKLEADCLLKIQQVKTRIPSASLLGQLELAAQAEKLEDKLNSLKKHAQRQLEKCHLGQDNLLTVLKPEHFEQEYGRIAQQERERLSINNWQPNTHSPKEAYRVYSRTLLNSLRKKRKVQND